MTDKQILLGRILGPHGVKGEVKIKSFTTNPLDVASYGAVMAPDGRRFNLLRARLQGDVVEIAVDDDGPGIPAERREEAFRPFHRLDSGRSLTGGGGVGLGLAIARDIARGHGGDITLGESKLGGLRAVVRLPV